MTSLHVNDAARDVTLTRRHLLAGVLGVVGASALASACGSSENGAATGQPPTGPPPSDGATIVQRFPQQVATPGDVRLPISLAAPDGTLAATGPDALTASILDADGTAVGETVTTRRRDAEPAPYWAFVTPITAPGLYFLAIDGVSGDPDGQSPPQGAAAFQVFDPSEVAVPTPGDVLPPFETPTVTDGRGVDPICTREPEPCPFHGVTLTEALASGTQVVYLVGTPAFCSTGSCAPGLESLIEVADEFSGTYTFVHAEVYTDDTATTIAPAVEALSLFYEPTVFVTDADGIVIDRLDSVWNTDELRETLQRLAG